MQTRQPANGSSSGHGNSRESEIGRYAKTLTCLGLIFLVSCASPSLKKSPDTLSSQFKNLCLSGEGHGRIAFLSGRHRFDYESMTLPKKREWALAFHYPGVGEKLIRLEYWKAYKGIFSYDFLDKLLVEIGDKKISENYREVLKEFFHRLALVIQTHEVFRMGFKNIWKCEQGNCEHKDIKMTWKRTSGKFFMEFPLADDYIFHFVSSSQDKYFNRMRIFVQRDKDVGIKRNPLEIMLFLNECYQK